MDLSELGTPCLVLDRGKLDENVRRMREHLSGRGPVLRPHAKTAKCIEVVGRTLDDPSGPVAVSTLKEAEYLFEHGIKDILYAVGIAPVKLERVARLQEVGADVTIVLDSVEMARVVAARGVELGTDFPVLVELDCDGERAGVTPGDPAFLEIGRVLEDEPGTELRGVMTYAGVSYQARTADEIRRVAARERDVAVESAGALRRAGLPCPVVSVGSTPTAWFAEELSGVTEVRAGVYMFNDLVMAGLGVCEVDDIAISVLASVIGRRDDRGFLITDAGWMSLSRDRGTAAQAVDQGDGLVCGIDGVPVGGLIVTSTNQEHGIVAGRRGGRDAFEGVRIGDAVRILPSHACATAAMHDRYHVVDGTTEVVEVWQRVNGW